MHETRIACPAIDLEALHTLARNDGYVKALMKKINSPTETSKLTA